ncbi:MAG TPA: NDP-sugar synthase [Pseudonocardiaceae bacterium]|nr:NDP-sugar synthase [Pseudonocardiaceae bacterium]
MSDIVGIALAGGLGVRARPLTLTTPGSIRSKATVPFLGKPLIDWQVRALSAQGIGEFCVVAKGRENRFQVREVLNYGESLNVRVRYSRPRHDRINAGSGESTLRNLEYWDLNGLALVFPTDSIFEFDLNAMVDAHLGSGAILTVGSVRCPAEVAARKYGVLTPDQDGWATRFMEKPSLDNIRTTIGTPTVCVNAGLYLIDVARFREIFAMGGLISMLASRLDWGSDLLPWLIAHGAPVLNWPIERLGDLGTPRDYLRTMREVLTGDYPDLTRMLPDRISDSVWIHESSLARLDPISGNTLAENISTGTVHIGPSVRIGRDVEIGPGTKIVASDIADGVDIREGCHLNGVACMDGSMIGPYARVADTYLGTMASVESTALAPVHIDGYTAIGDEATVGPDTILSGQIVPPRGVVGARSMVAVS